MWQSVKLPAGKMLIPGVISHATNIVEHPELVAQRLVRLAKLVGRENVMAGTDCGFAQSPFAKRVHESIMWAKLRSLSEGARIASAELWGDAARLEELRKVPAQFSAPVAQDRLVLQAQLHVPRLDRARSQIPSSRPSPGAITSTARSPARGRTAPR